MWCRTKMWWSFISECSLVHEDGHAEIICDEEDEGAIRFGMNEAEHWTKGVSRRHGRRGASPLSSGENCREAFSWLRQRAKPRQRSGETWPWSLFDRHALGQVTGLIHVTALAHSSIIGQ